LERWQASVHQSPHALPGPLGTQSIRAIGVDEIQYAKGHKYLTLVYQIDAGAPGCCGSARNAPSPASKASSPSPGRDPRQMPQALHILDRFHIVAHMNKTLDEIRAAEARKLVQEGNAPLLKKTRWCVLKRKENLTAKNSTACAICCATTCQPSAPTCSKRTSKSSTGMDLDAAGERNEFRNCSQPTNAPHTRRWEPRRKWRPRRENHTGQEARATGFHARIETHGSHVVESPC
jgi:hypothetical protein